MYVESFGFFTFFCRQAQTMALRVHTHYNAKNKPISQKEAKINESVMDFDALETLSTVKVTMEKRDA